jgi:hypothetical protein
LKGVITKRADIGNGKCYAFTDSNQERALHMRGDNVVGLTLVRIFLEGLDSGIQPIPEQFASRDADRNFRRIRVPCERDGNTRRDRRDLESAGYDVASLLASIPDPGIREQKKLIAAACGYHYGHRNFVYLREHTALSTL